MEQYIHLDQFGSNVSCEASEVNALLEIESTHLLLSSIDEITLSHHA